MSFFARGKKQDLQMLADDLGLNVTRDLKVIDLKDLILKSDGYDEEFAKERYDVIIANRLEEEKMERIREERAFELEKLKIEASLREGLETVDHSNLSTQRVPDITKLIPNFNPEQSDISLYLVIFERQAKRAKIDKRDWVSYLMRLLPLDIVQLIARESEEEASDYDYIKKLLLKRFKLSPEIFRQKFVSHQKENNSTWKDFVFESRNYLEEWLEGLGVRDFEALKDLMITDQVKKRVTAEIREHFIDEWATIKTSCMLADQLDNYDDVRKIKRKSNDKTSKFEKAPASISNRRDGRFDAPRFPPPRERNFQNKSNDQFEKRRIPRCYMCQSTSHLKPNCPLLDKPKRDSTSVESVNFLREGVEQDFLAPYIKKGKINGHNINILRDSGSSLDVVSRKYIKTECFTGENVWVKQPLDLNQICLPLAEVEISGEFGTIKTKAAVCADVLDEGRYILGNRTASLIKDTNGFEFSATEYLNAIQTRSQARRAELEKKLGSEEDPGEQNKLTRNDEAILSELNSEEPLNIPDLLINAPEISLLEVSGADFKKAQQNSQGLRELFDIASGKIQSTVNKTYFIENDVLVKHQEDRLGNLKKMLVVPEEFREKIKTLCHEGTSGHLGCTKSKDKLGRYFYWPNCYKEMEDFVRTCDQCQRAGKPNEKKKAPLKLVPVIQEVFSKLNIDACGPLPLTPSGNRYLITAICMSSKYPEAIPVPDISSVTITNALLNIFSRMGFPREVQCDQGTSFTSNLTSEFFERFGIKVSHSSVYHPQSNPVERFHRTIKRLLRALCLEAGPDWENNLPSALIALRTVTHESTGFSPAELVHGKNLRTPETLLYEHWTECGEETSLVTEYVFKLINRLKRCQEVAISKMEELQIKRKLWYDKNTVKREFKEGDLVLVLATSRPNKLAVQWIGPGTIRSKISETNYIIEMPGKKERSQIYHVNMLKPYYKRPECINLITCEGVNEDLVDHEFNFPCLETNPTIYNFQDIVQNSELDRLLEPSQLDQLSKLLKRYSKSFSNDPGLTDLVVHDIELISNKTIRSKPYRASHRQNEILKTEIQRMLDLRIIKIGESDYTSPMILVEVPGKDPRPCVDYRRLNEIIRTEFFPLPNIEERVEQVAASRYVTVLDFSKGYFQIALTPKAQRIAAFCTSFGTYLPLRMCFGLKNAPYFFSKLMAELLRGCEEFALPYLDDIAIFSENWESHLKHLDCVLDRIMKANLTLKPSKCKFAQNHVKYLGHIVGNGFRSPAQAKIQSIIDFPAPRTKTQIRAFLGLAGYYSRYIPMFSVIAAPLTNALRGRVKRGEITWTEDCEKSFQELKGKLTDKPVLYAPDFGREFIVQTDSSDFGMGIVLSQLNDNQEEHPVLYLSKKFSNTEKKYGTTEKECASIIFAIKKLHYYLDGQKFTVITDHNPLVWLRSNASSNPRLMRWALALQPYEFKIIHRSGKDNKNADALSRS